MAQKWLKICLGDLLKRDSSLQINCENLLMGSTMSFPVVLDQTLAFTTLDEKRTVHAFHLKCL